MPFCADPLQALVAFAAQGERRMVCLVAEPGAGKTTLAAQLERDVNERFPGACRALSMDGFHLTRAQLDGGVAGRSPAECHRRRGAPWTFDGPGFAARLRALKKGTGAVAWPAFDHAKKDPEEDAVVVEATVTVVLVEGLYCLHRADGFEGCEGMFDLAWYLGTPFDLAHKRLVARHQAAWGISEEEAEKRANENDGVNALLVRASAKNASGIVSSREGSQ